MKKRVWSIVNLGKLQGPMLCPDLIRQRCIIEFITNLDMNDFSFMKTHLTSFLNELTIGLEMKSFIGPIIGSDINEIVKESGLSAFVGWTTSGCQIHSWPYRHFVSIDIYSCKNYSLEVVMNTVEKYFNPIEGVVFEGPIA